MTRPYVDPWTRTDLAPAVPDIALIRRKTRYDPVCEFRHPDGTYCRSLSVSAAVVPSGSASNLRDLRARCHDHRGDAPAICTACYSENAGPDPLRCPRCATRWTTEREGDE